MGFLQGEHVDLHKEQEAFALDVSRLISEIFYKGYSCTLGEAYRTPEQAKIYASERKGIINSLHCQRLAIDINLFDPEGNYLTGSDSYREFGEYWESLNPKNKWGGNFTGKLIDGNHYQRSLL